VLSTLHTVDAPETINRIIDFFPPHQHQQARAMIAGTLQAIISQRLVPTIDGKGRVACCEIMVKTGRVRDMILDPKQTGELPEVVADGEYYGMQTFDQGLLKHVRAGRISLEAAFKAATSPHDFKLMVAAETRGGHAAPATRDRGARAGSPARARHAACAAHLGTVADDRRPRAIARGRRCPAAPPRPPVPAAPPPITSAPPPGR
jgi:twitching motility protein PilT